MTFLTYACAQVLLILLWIADWVFWRRNKSGVISAASKTMPVWANLVWYFFFAIGVLFSAFIGVFGTGMCQMTLSDSLCHESSLANTVFWLMGIYRNCLCLVPVSKSNNGLCTSR
jgi:hypothetical protein